MGDLRIKKVCGFNISSIHFSMMILPYIKKEINLGKNVITILEEKLDNDINKILSKITITDDEKMKILNINWNKTDIKESAISRKIVQKILDDSNLDIIVYGNERYIKTVNEIIKKIINKNIKQGVKKDIKIVNCYTVKEFNENLREILDNHDIMFNTSGEHKIEEVFQGYKKTS